MTEKQKDISKLIIPIIIGIILIISIIVLITKINKTENEIIPETPYTEEELKNNSNPIFDKAKTAENNTTQYTPIEDDIIEEGIISKEDAEKPLLDNKFEIKKSENPTTKNNQYLINYTNKTIENGDYFNVYGIDFYVEPQINKLTNKNSMIYMRQTLHYKENANELKNIISEFIEKFTNDNSNIIFKRNLHIRNLYDTPLYGIRILSEDDNDFHYLFISEPSDKHKYIAIEYVIASKTEEQLLTRNQKIPMLLSDIENMLSLSGSTFEFKTKKETANGIFEEIIVYDETPDEETLALQSMYKKNNTEEKNNTENNNQKE